MANCIEIIEKIYRHPRFNAVLKTIKPIELQDDLRQEVALALLEYDCNKLIELNNQGKLINFTIGIMWKMGTLQNGNFYKTFKRNELAKAIEYVNSFEGEDMPEDYITIAKDILKNKMLINPNEAHESIIFMKYVELQSHQKVADYFSIPRLHVLQVVNNVKKELKKDLRK